MTNPNEPEANEPQAGAGNGEESTGYRPQYPGYPRPSSVQPSSNYPYPTNPEPPSNYPYPSGSETPSNYPYPSGPQSPSNYPYSSGSETPGNYNYPAPSGYPYTPPTGQIEEAPEYADPRQAQQAQVGLAPLPIPQHPVLATYAILAMIVAMYVVTIVADGIGGGGLSFSSQFSSETLVNLGALYTPLVRDGEWWRLITVIFLHANLIHIGLNGFNMYILGKQLEALLGPARYTVLFFLSGLGGSIASFGLHSEPVLAVGASGAIFGLLGGMIGYFLRQRDQFGMLGRRYLQSLLSTVALNFVILFLIPGVDNIAHGGGLVTGFVLGYLLSPLYTFSQTADHRLKITQRDTTSPLWLVYAALVAVALVGLFLFFLSR